MKRTLIVDYIRDHIIWWLPGWIYFAVVWSRMFVFDGTYFWAGWINVWGDWTVHLIYLFNFAHRGFWVTNHPLFAGEPFRYHFLADLLSAVLWNLGLRLDLALVLPSVALSFLLVIGLFHFYEFFLKSKIWASVASMVFLCNGGLGFLWMITYGNASGYLTDKLFQATFVEPVNIHFQNVITSEFIPQRPFLLGFPITIWVLLVLYKQAYRLDVNEIKNALFIVISACVAGFLPLIHLHSYLIVVGYSIWLIGEIFLKRRTVDKDLIVFISIAGMIGLPLLYSLGFLGASQVSIHLGWMAKLTSESLIWFWLKNFGVVVVVLPVALFLLYKEKNVDLLKLLIPFQFVFVATHVFSFQYEVWDNMKLLTYWYLVSVIGIVWLLRKIINSHRYVIALLVVPIFFLLIFSGLIDATNILRFESNKYRLFSTTDLKRAREISQLIGSQDVVLTAPYNSSLTVLMGRQVFLGLEYWVRTAGFDSSERVSVVENIYEGSTEAQTLIHEYDIGYILVGKTEKKIYTVNYEFLNRYRKIHEDPEVTIYVTDI